MLCTMHPYTLTQFSHSLFLWGGSRGQQLKVGLEIPYGSKGNLWLYTEARPSEIGDKIMPAGPSPASGSFFLVVIWSRYRTIMRSLYSKKWVDVQGFTNFTAARFVVKYHAMNTRVLRGAG